MLCLFSKTHTYKCKVVVVAQGHTQAGKGSRNVLALLLQYSVLRGGVIQESLILCFNSFIKLIDSSGITAEQRHRMFLPLRQIIGLNNK